MNNSSHRLLLSNIRQLVTVAAPSHYLTLKQTTTIHPQSNISIAVDSKGIISKIASPQEISQWVKEQSITFEHEKDCSNLIVLPGLVDAHTHALFAGDRSKEYDMKLNGLTYVDIYNEGLGIRYTTQQINEAPLDSLVRHLEKYVAKMSKCGTTSVQIKSGYGLNAEAEVKMLRAIELARQKFEGKVDIISTFCGAHAIPKGKTQQEQTLDVIDSQIPAVKQAWLKGEINPKFIDVFCQRKFFERDSSIRIMKAGKEAGMIPSFHGDELSNLESGSIAEQVGALGVSHLQYLSQESVKIMAKNKIAGVLLPTTQNIEKLPVPPIKLMREHDMIVALGSDFCPNAYCYNMALVTHYACTNYRLTPKEALAAATINSAYALGISNQVGSIQLGKKGDFLILDSPEWVALMYNFGDSPIDSVIKQGKIQ